VRPSSTESAVTEPGVTPVALDITDPERVARAAAQCADVSALVNNAGVMKASTFTGAPGLDAARLEMEANYFGTLSMSTPIRSMPPTAPRRPRRGPRARDGHEQLLYASAISKMVWKASKIWEASPSTSPISAAVPSKLCSQLPAAPRRSDA
jgi:NAD(P)-dependent dehydrogenase (short-subunit alcohol dehydrogenase family)